MFQCGALLLHMAIFIIGGAAVGVGKCKHKLMHLDMYAMLASIMKLHIMKLHEAATIKLHL